MSPGGIIAIVVFAILLVAFLAFGVYWAIEHNKPREIPQWDVTRM